VSEFVSPKNLDEALQARAEHPEFVAVAGGTDYMVASKDRAAPAGLISLFGISELSSIDDTADGGLRIGACVPYAKILADRRVADRYPVLRAACREVGASQIQARGTIGGNVATSSPVGDSLPPLLALEARVELASHRGQRSVDYEKFLIGYRKIDLAPDELIVAVVLPALHANTVQQWRKVGTRRAQSISKVMMAATAHIEEGKIARARIALGAVADRIVRAKAAEAAMVGQKPNAETGERAAIALAGEITPINDLRSSADYRLGVAQNLVRRFVLNL